MIFDNRIIHLIKQRKKTTGFICCTKFNGIVLLQTSLPSLPTISKEAVVVVVVVEVLLYEISTLIHNRIAEPTHK